MHASGFQSFFCFYSDTLVLWLVSMHMRPQIVTNNHLHKWIAHHRHHMDPKMTITMMTVEILRNKFHQCYRFRSIEEAPLIRFVTWFWGLLIVNYYSLQDLRFSKRNAKAFPTSFEEFYLLPPLLINQSTMDIANIASAKPYVILINILSRPSKSLMLTIFFTTFSNKFYHQY